MSSPNAKPLRIGVLFSDSVQLLDIAGIDLFGMLSPSYLEVVNLPPQIVELGVPSEIHYIGPSSTSTGRCTANVTINLTDTVSSPPVSPGNLDILMIPGPLPSHIPSDEVKAFVRGHHEAGTTILTICTGCLIAAQAGIFDGKRVSGPRGLISMFRERFPNVKEWNDTQRFVRDGNIWSSGKLF